MPADLAVSRAAVHLRAVVKFCSKYKHLVVSYHGMSEAAQAVIRIVLLHLGILVSACDELHQWNRQ